MHLFTIREWHFNKKKLSKKLPDQLKRFVKRPVVCNKPKNCLIYTRKRTMSSIQLLDIYENFGYTFTFVGEGFISSLSFHFLVTEKTSVAGI